MKKIDEQEVKGKFGKFFFDDANEGQRQYRPPSERRKTGWSRYIARLTRLLKISSKQAKPHEPIIHKLSETSTDSQNAIARAAALQKVLQLKEKISIPFM